jgi:hypothetical protein
MKHIILVLILFGCSTPIKSKPEETRTRIEEMMFLKDSGFDCFITNIDHGSKWCEKLGDKFSCCLIDENIAK